MRASGTPQFVRDEQADVRAIDFGAHKSLMTCITKTTAGGLPGFVADFDDSLASDHGRLWACARRPGKYVAQ